MGGGAELGANNEPPCGGGDLLHLGEARESSADVGVGDQATVAENITELLRISESRHSCKRNQRICNSSIAIIAVPAAKLVAVKKISKGTDFAVLFQKRGSLEKVVGLVVAAAAISDRRRQQLTVLRHR
ncbi:hypothetical protein MRB53_016654 [Persea americana]|uniref:Uncharacterized protein n=1 Tax=Persea americana TaxID=3435 RepID=A0ACC2M2X0_PERAE|nr:hypothetical protein MRB53_016654 [Persea americana]